MADSNITTTKPEGTDTSAQVLLKMLEVLNRNGGRNKGRFVDSSTPLSGQDCVQFVAGGDGATIASVTSPDLVGSFAGFPLAAGQPFPFEFTAISLSDGNGYAIDRASP